MSSRRDALRVAVDAGSLVRDRRGMGRIARAALRAALGDPAFDVTLLAEAGSDASALRREFPTACVRSRAAARSDAYDVVWFPFNGMRFACAAPALVTLHDAFAFSEPHPGRIARFREQAPIRTAVRRARRILTDSEWSRAEIVRLLGVPLQRIAVVRPAPDPFWFPADGDALPQALSDQSYALLVGVREKRKNAELALRACARALRGRNESLVVVGEVTREQQAYVRAAGLRAGHVAAGDTLLRALYRRARVVLVPSLAEGFGLVAGEAMACGAPVIASNSAALPEATGDAALLLDPGDTGAWTDAIRDVFDDDALAANLRARSIARFTGCDRLAWTRRALALLRATAAATS